jgi:hypothetical protein
MGKGSSLSEEAGGTSAAAARGGTLAAVPFTRLFPASGGRFVVRHRRERWRGGREDVGEVVHSPDAPDAAVGRRGSLEPGSLSLSRCSLSLSNLRLFSRF